MAENDREEAVAFFLEHAGWSYNPRTETAEDGRRRGAEDLADAEAWAESRGLEVDWMADNDADTSCACGEDHGPAYGAVLRAEDRTALESLWGITLDGWDDPYRRVVAAELALEARAAFVRVLCQ